MVPQIVPIVPTENLIRTVRVGSVKLTSLDQDEAGSSEDQAAVTSAHTVNDRARNIR